MILGFTLLAVAAIQMAQAQLAFNNHPSSVEDVEGATAFLSGFPSPFSPELEFQWLKDGIPLDGATNSSLQVTLSADTAGVYVLSVTDGVNSAESEAATVVLATLSAATTEFIKVVDTTDEMPGLAPRKFGVLRDGRLRNGVTTIAGTDTFESAGGVFRYEGGIGAPIVTESDSLPGFAIPATFFGSKTVLDDGTIHMFVTSNPDADAVIDEFAVLGWRDGEISIVADEQTEIPNKASATFEGLGWPYRAMGKTAFLGRGLGADLPDNAGYRGAFILDENGLHVWADNDTPLPAGDGVWNGNSAQVGFDGETLAFWATDGSHQNGIFVTKNAGPLKKAAFKGDLIPGTSIGFEGFTSPPVVSNGRLLFVGRTSDFSKNYLLELSGSELQILTKSGDPIPGAGLGLGRVAHWFEPAADGSVIFTSHGPGQKQGIYRLMDGTIEPILTTLNRINGVRLQGVSLRDVDKDSILAELRFEDGVSGYYTARLDLESTPSPP
ncbi:MAG: hypothetical protein HOI66_13315, partial [Verrucomicrobia bacterium]|nr:hypothetical protein [Verrucomicrobiota bacterium]